MAWIAGVVAAVATVAGAAVSGVASAEAASAQEQGARDAARLAEMNAQASERETAQAASNLAEDQANREAANKAKASASGVSVSDLGSFGLVLDEQKNINKDQLAWLRESGSNQADIIRAQGKSAYNVGMASASATKAQAIGSGIGTVSSLYGTAQNSGWLNT